jgi:diguanylate cyclase (GGDEF)-like protein/PAS domain S-box-containing protein
MSINHHSSPDPDGLLFQTISVDQTQYLNNPNAELEWYRTLCQNLPSIYFSLNLEGNIIYVSPFAAQRVGVTPEELIGKTIGEIVFPLDRANFEAKWVDFINNSEGLTSWECRLQGKNDDIFWVKIQAKRCDYSTLNIVILQCQEIDEYKIALQQFDTQVHDILNNASAAIISFRVFPDRTWEYNYYSSGCETIFGYTPQELMRDRDLWFSRVHPEDRDHVIIPIFDSFFSEKSIRIEYRFYHKDGSVRWISDTYTSRKDSRINAWNVTTIATNITSCKNTEKALQESEMRFRQLAENMGEVFYITSFQDQELIYVSPAYQKIWGQSLEHIYRNPSAWLEAIHPDDCEQVRRDFSDKLQGKSMQSEYRIIRPDGSICWIFDRNFPVFDSEGNVIYHVGLAEDISERKKTEEARRVSQARFAGILEIANDAIISIDQSQNITLFNQGAEKIFGYTSEEVLGKNLTILLPLSAFSKHSQHIDKFGNSLEKSRKMGFSNKILGRRKDGIEFPAEASISQLKLGNEIIFTAIVRDITEQKKAEQKLKQQAEREQLLSMITQRIRQSLDLEEILTTTVREVRQLLQADRVLIYHIDSNNNGVVLTEATATDISPILGKPLPEEIFPQECYPLYRQGRIRTVIDVETDPMSPCLANTLREIGVKSKMVVPLLYCTQENNEFHDTLWGLLIAHHCRDPREWQTLEIDLLKQLASQVGIAIQQSQLYQQTQLQAQREKALNKVIQALRQSFDLKTIFSTTLSEVAKFSHLDSAQIVRYFPDEKVWIPVYDYRKNVIVPSALGIEISDENNEFSERLKRLEVVKINDASTSKDDINRQLAENFPGTWLLIPLDFQVENPQTQQHQVWGSLTLVRNNLLTPWLDWEVKLLCVIADQLAIAIHQSELYQELRAANLELEQKASLDGLTEIANRRRFDEYLNSEWQQHLWQEKPLSLILLDVDYFKSYNDTYGHLAGDDCLRQVARVIQHLLEKSKNLVARYGGEEFAVILPDTNIEGARAVAHRIQYAIKQLYIVHEKSTVSDFISVSLGISSIIPTPDFSPQILINRADTALYCAKQQGRDRYCEFQI